MIILGLTGSIGMGKTTTAALFAEENVAVYNADEAVYKLYQNEECCRLIEAAFPGVVYNGVVDRAELSKRVINNESAMKCLEDIVHPLVRKEERHFLNQAEKDGKEFALLDIPLLFETHAENRVDYTIVVTAPVEIQQQRVMMRKGMTKEKFDAILARQMPDKEKKEQADFIIDTGKNIENARFQVKSVLDDLKSRIQSGKI